MDFSKYIYKDVCQYKNVISNWQNIFNLNFTFTTLKTLQIIIIIFLIVIDYTKKALHFIIFIKYPFLKPLQYNRNYKTSYHYFRLFIQIFRLLIITEIMSYIVVNSSANAYRKCRFSIPVSTTSSLWFSFSSL